MTKLSSVTVGASAQSSISFTNIPQGYTDLVIKVSARTAAAQGVAELSFNSGTTNLSSRIIFAIGSGSAGSASYSSLRAGYIIGTDYTASVFSNNEIYISNYSSNTFKSVGVDSVTENNATEAYSSLNAGLWSNSAPITSLTFTVLNNSNGVASTYVQHSTFTLYGVKSMAQTAGNSIKATGGNIVFDGTYVYHVFDSTGAFTPTQPILADYLIIAGGGSGAPSRGGGGGAGGLRSTVSPTGGGGAADPILSLVPGTYTVTVGAGATAIDGRASGNNSSFATIISTGGGGGASPNQGLAALSGGSGGGGGYGLAAGSASPSGQGYAGGAGNATYIGGAGGGGAGAIGANASGTNNNGGNGGNGILGTAWSVATGTGVNGYYAGGGGGGFFSENGTTGGTGGLGGGGNGKTTSTAAIAGTPNTGGGGGSGRGNPGGVGDVIDGANGGSGLVIVRYKG
jgi:hypothetical protein